MDDQGVGRVSAFIICVFRKIPTDCIWQNWEDHVQTSDKFSVNRKFNGIPHFIKL